MMRQTPRGAPMGAGSLPLTVDPRPETHRLGDEVVPRVGPRGHVPRINPEYVAAPTADEAIKLATFPATITPFKPEEGDAFDVGWSGMGQRWSPSRQTLQMLWRVSMTWSVKPGNLTGYAPSSVRYEQDHRGRA